MRDIKDNLLAESEGPFHLVAQLERRRPEAGPLGTATPPQKEPVRFRTALKSESANLCRGPTATEAITGEPAELMVSGPALVGPYGVLPESYTADALTAAAQGHDAAAAFLDLFQHRILSLHYRAWAKYRPGVRSQEEDRYRTVLRALTGMERDGTALELAWLFAALPRSAEGLEAILSDFLGVPCRVGPLRGRWGRLRPEDTTALAGPLTPLGQNACLGQSCVLGDRVWEADGEAEVHLGPLFPEAYEKFLPGQPLFTELVKLLRLYGGPWSRVRATLIWDGPEPGLRLGVGHLAAGTPRLGETTWLAGGPPGPRPGVVLTVEADV
jgi:type VI secretion system protein ImpH